METLSSIVKFHRFFDADWLWCLVAMVITTDHKVTIDSQVHATGSRRDKSLSCFVQIYVAPVQIKNGNDALGKAKVRGKWHFWRDIWRNMINEYQSLSNELHNFENITWWLDLWHFSSSSTLWGTLYRSIEFMHFNWSLRNNKTHFSRLSVSLWYIHCTTLMSSNNF